jgi:hypothetical protein
MGPNPRRDHRCDFGKRAAQAQMTRDREREYDRGPLARSTPIRAGACDDGLNA